MSKKLADLINPTPYGGETPQALSDKGQRDNDFQDIPHTPKQDYTEAPEQQTPRAYQWVMNGAFVSVHESADPIDLFTAMGHGDFSRPYAYGKLSLHSRFDAVWEITYSNMALHLVEQRLKRYSTDQGWSHVGITDDTGMPFSGLGVAQASVHEAEAVGVGEHDYPDGNWNVDDNNPETDVKPVDFYGEKDYPDETDPQGPRICSECGQLCFDYNDWRLHVLRQHVNPDRSPPQTPQPVLNLDQVMPADFNNEVMDTTVQRQSRLIWQLSKIAADQLIAGPIFGLLPEHGVNGQKVWLHNGSIMEEFEWRDD